MDLLEEINKKIEELEKDAADDDMSENFRWYCRFAISVLEEIKERSNYEREQ